MMRWFNPSQAQITAWVNKHFPDCKPRRNGDELVINNPFDDDTGFHFNISTIKGVVHDWRGDSTWAPVNKKTGKRQCSFLKFVQLYLKCAYADAIRDISGSAAINYLYKQSPTEELEIPDRPNDENEIPLPSDARPLDEALVSGDLKKVAQLMVRWLKSRGVSIDDIRRHKLHMNASEVIWPYYEWDDKVVYWQCRSPLNKRFRFPPEESGKTPGRSLYLYGFDQVEPASYLIMVEAIFGAHTLGEQTVATGGASITDNQAKRAKALGPRDGVILAPDNDAAGVESIIANAKIPQNHGLTVQYSLPPKLPFVDDDGETKLTKDWNEIETKLKKSKAEIRQIMWDGVRNFDISSRFYLHSLLAQAGKKRTKN